MKQRRSICEYFLRNIWAVKGLNTSDILTENFFHVLIVLRFDILHYIRTEFCLDLIGDLVLLTLDYKLTDTF